jgi:hypothetical protein
MTQPIWISVNKGFALSFALAVVNVSSGFAENPSQEITLRPLPSMMDRTRDDWTIYRDSTRPDHFYFAPRRMHVSKVRIAEKVDVSASCELAQLFERKIVELFRASVELSKDSSMRSRLIRSKMEIVLEKAEVEASLSQLKRSNPEPSNQSLELEARLQSIETTERQLDTEIKANTLSDEQVDPVLLSLTELQAQREVLRRWTASKIVDFEWPRFAPAEQSWRQEFGLSDRARAEVVKIVSLQLSPSQEAIDFSGSLELARWRNSFGGGDIRWSVDPVERPGVFWQSEGISKEDRSRLATHSLPRKITFERELSLVQYCRERSNPSSEDFDIRYSILAFEDANSIAEIGSVILEARIPLSPREAKSLQRFSAPAENVRSIQSVDLGTPLRYSGEGRFVDYEQILDLISTEKDK